MEGYTNGEIALRWQKSERTIERKLQTIRQLWTAAGDGDGDPPEACGTKVVLLVATGPQRGQRFVLDRSGTIVVGRGPAADLRLIGGDNSVSRAHFQVEFGPDLCRLTNLSHSNSTLVNGQSVTATDLHHGDVILAGETAIRVSIEPA
jgi:pSer/pThr/pTyr-binding forkhead associated (FHA) protein